MMGRWLKTNWNLGLLALVMLSLTLLLVLPLGLPESVNRWVTLLLPNLLVGSIAGVLAGLLGVGGGLVIVPMLVFILPTQGVPHDSLMHLALGTSMASILFTSVSSFMAHHRRGAVRWDIVRRIVVGILIGTFLGAQVVSLLSTDFLKAFFVIFAYYVAVQMLANYKPKPSRQLPSRAGLLGAGGVIGLVSSFVGIGGGSLSVPFMVWCNIPMHTAIGTSAAIGFPIAVAGTAGYVVSGLAASNLPPLCLGYLYLPALIGIVGASVLTAPLGARLAHRLPVAGLKKVFAVLLIVMGTRLLWGLVA